MASTAKRVLVYTHMPAAMRMERSAPIRDIASLPRRQFADLDRGWLALLDLSITLECWWTHRSASPIWQSLKSARTLEGVAEALIKEYLTLDGQRQDERWVGFIMRRQSWGMPKATLDEIGIECGVTRERVRQIEVETLDRLGRQLGSNQSLALLFRSSSDDGEGASNPTTGRNAPTTTSLNELLSSKHQSKYSKPLAPKADPRKTK